MISTEDIHIWVSGIVSRDRPVVRWYDERRGEFYEMCVSEQVHSALSEWADAEDDEPEFWVCDVAFVIQADFEDDTFEECLRGSAAILIDGKEFAIELRDVPDFIWHEFIEEAALEVEHV